MTDTNVTYGGGFATFAAGMMRTTGNVPMRGSKQTISFWVNLRTLHACFEQLSTGHGAHCLTGRWGGSGSFLFKGSFDAVAWDGDGVETGNLIDGSWKHVVFTRDGTNAKVYVNGALVSSTSAFSTMDFYDRPFIIGGVTRDGAIESYGLSADMKKYRIYNRVPNTAEIAALYADS